MGATIFLNCIFFFFSKVFKVLWMGYCFVHLNEISHSYKQMIPECSLMSNHKASEKIHTHTHTHTHTMVKLEKNFKSAQRLGTHATRSRSPGLGKLVGPAAMGEINILQTWSWLVAIFQIRNVLLNCAFYWLSKIGNSDRNRLCRLVITFLPRSKRYFKSCKLCNCSNVHNPNFVPTKFYCHFIL